MTKAIRPDQAAALAAEYDINTLQRAYQLALEKQAKEARGLPFVNLAVFTRARMEFGDIGGFIEVASAPSFSSLLALPRDSRTLAVRCTAGRIVVRSDCTNVIGVSVEDT